MPKLGRLWQFPFLALILWGVRYLEDNFAQAGIFSDRVGSDELRDRIGDAAAAKAAGSPPYGMGLGQATASIDGKDWFFHDSFLGLYVEGGWVALIGVVGIFVLLGLRPFSRVVSHRSAYLEAATVGLLICASKLGEVFLSLPGFLLLGILVGLGLSTTAFVSRPRDHEAVT